MGRARPVWVDAVFDEAFVNVNSHDFASCQPGVSPRAVGALELDNLRKAAFERHRTFRHRGTPTSLLGVAVSPAIVNALISWAAWAAVAFICFASRQFQKELGWISLSRRGRDEQCLFTFRRYFIISRRLNKQFRSAFAIALCLHTEKGNAMSYRTAVAVTAALLAIACASTDALAYRGGGRAGGVRVGAVHRGGAYRGAYVRRGVRVGVGIGAAAVGAAVVAPRYYDSVACGYYPNPPCY
jgi:hypothetical protein